MSYNLNRDGSPKKVLAEKEYDVGNYSVLVSRTQLIICDTNSGQRTVIMCLRTGEVEFSEHLTPTEAAHEFWDALSQIPAFKNFNR